LEILPSHSYATFKVGVNDSVVFAAFNARAVPPATRFHAQIALPVLSDVVTSTHDFTEAGQSVADPVANVLTANAIADGFAADAVGSDSVCRAYPVPVISPTPPPNVSPTTWVVQSLVERRK
jgi:hypothetical protein